MDLVPLSGGSRASSLEKLFKKNIPRAFPEAASSVIRMIMPEEDSFRVDPLPNRMDRSWVDGKARNIAEWGLTDGDMTGKDVRFWWHEEGDFKHRKLRFHSELKN